MVAPAQGRTRSIEKAREATLLLLLIYPVWLAATPLQCQLVRLPAAGTILEGELSGGEVHRYALERNPNEELWITVDQDGIDLAVSIVGADGEVRLSVDNPGGLWGGEWLYVQGESPPSETLEIRALTPAAAPGRYRLSVESRYSVGPVDSKRRVAERAVTEAGRLNRVGTRQSSAPRPRPLSRGSHGMAGARSTRRGGAHPLCPRHASPGARRARRSTSSPAQGPRPMAEPG